MVTKRFEITWEAPEKDRSFEEVFFTAEVIHMLCALHARPLDKLEVKEITDDQDHSEESDTRSESA